MNRKSREESKRTTNKPSQPSRLSAANSDITARHEATKQSLAALIERPRSSQLRLEGELTPRECATVLHGLRMIQENANGPEDCVSGTCEHFDDYPPLTDAEIDTLAERINLGPESKTWTPPKEDQHFNGYCPTCGQICGCESCITEEQRTIPELKRQLNAAVELCGSLAASLKECHGENNELETGGGSIGQNNEDFNHNGDGGEGCDYCEAIIAADKLQREVIGLEPRRQADCPTCGTTRPAEDNGDCLLCGTSIAEDSTRG